MKSSFAKIQNEPSVLEKIQMIAGVDFVGLINSHGRFENYVPGTNISLTAQKREMFCMGVTLSHKMQSDFDEDFGPVKYSVTERGNSKFVTIPILSKVLFVRMRKDSDHLDLINKITSFFTNDAREVNNASLVL